MIEMDFTTIKNKIQCAHSLSKKDGRLRFVIMFPVHITISLRNPGTDVKRWVTNGERVWFYDEGIQFSKETGVDLTEHFID